MNNKLYELEINFKNGKGISLNNISEYCFAKRNLFIKKSNGDCLSFPKDDIDEAYRKLEGMKEFKKILIPKGKN